MSLISPILVAALMLALDLELESNCIGKLKSTTF